MKQIPLLIELKPGSHNSDTWQLNNNIWARGDLWVQERKRWMYPIITIGLFCAFGLAMSPWVKNYQTAKEINQIATEMHSFKSLYGSYGDLHTTKQQKNFAEPLESLLGSVTENMSMLGLSEQKIDVVKSTYSDKDYYLVGSTKEILVKPMTYAACERMMGERRQLHQSLQRAVRDSLEPKHRKEISCYLQTWQATPPKELAEYAITLNGVITTPMALLVIRPEQAKKKPTQKKTAKLISV